MNDPSIFESLAESLPPRRNGPPSIGRRARLLLWVPLLAFVLLLAISRLARIYVGALWFDSLGYASAFWTTLGWEAGLFGLFFVLTAGILRGGIGLAARALGFGAMPPSVVKIDHQPVTFAPGRILNWVSWPISLGIGFLTALAMSAEWNLFALWVHQPLTASPDPIFGRTLGFYLFTLPAYQALSLWLVCLSLVLLSATALLGSLAQAGHLSSEARKDKSRAAFRAVSVAFALFLAAMSWRVSLWRFGALSEDHDAFAGVGYADAHVWLPGLVGVSIVLALGAVVVLWNGWTRRRLSLSLATLVAPIALYVLLGFAAGYVNSIIVKPNELGRESPYIAHNIEATRQAFNLDHIASREFPARTGIAAFGLPATRSTLDNIRLWDWQALQDTLRQVQEIRTYYDFPDVDLDRYRIGGRMRQVMIAARELDVDKLPPSSRNWVNERLIYTHGYGVTMNTANEFTSEGLPRFLLSDMPVAAAATAPELKVTRPEIYFGQKTDTPVYVKTRAKEFNFPQGDANNYSTYEGTGGIPLGGFVRRTLLAWTLGDLSKLPFSDDVTADSRVLLVRNIRDRVERIAPFLTVDDDPYIVVSKDGRLFWMLDAYTSSDAYPYSRHYVTGDQSVNYFRNSVKITIDAYNGDVNFYVFDPTDPIINAYRGTFPVLFKDAAAMPADLREHVRYPEELLNVQAQAYSLYHTSNVKVFFGREDVWNVGRQVGMGGGAQQQEQAYDPYFVLMQLPGVNPPGSKVGDEEFVHILPFTPSSRNNMIGWVAGRSDGAAYGSLVAYTFPKSTQVTGPLQMEARIDQNTFLCAQFTLLNQQGSHVRRGDLLVIPIGKGLLYVEPIYLQAERSPMPELRYVVLATQDLLVYGSNFEEALAKLLGTAPDNTPSDASTPSGTTPSGTPAPGRPGAGTPSRQELIHRAAADLAAYQRLTAQGKLAEAGQHLESLKKNLDALQR